MTKYWLTAFLSLGMISPALGDVIMKIQTFDNFGAAKTMFAPGDSVTVRLVAIDETNDPDASGPNFATDPLSSFQATLSASGAGATEVDTAVGTETYPNLNFPLPTAGTYSGGNRRLNAASFPAINPPVPSPFTLAQFSFTANAVGITSLGFNTSSNSNNVINFSNGPANGYRLVADVGSSAGLSLSGASISVVPEPSGLMVLGLAVAGACVRRRRT